MNEGAAMTPRLYYAHDPMCSWCYAFRPSLTALLRALDKEVEIVRLLGGLAKDSDEPMPEQTRSYVINNWRRIEQTVPGTVFNYDFWQKCQPRRSTYPACRAVIAARLQGDPPDKLDRAMTQAIQDAYYQKARNPSDSATLISLAAELGLDKDKFSADLRAKETHAMLREEIEVSRQLGLNSFPGLLLDDGRKQLRLEPDYIDADAMIEKAELFIRRAG